MAKIRKKTVVWKIYCRIKNILQSLPLRITFCRIPCGLKFRNCKWNCGFGVSHSLRVPLGLGFLLPLPPTSSSCPIEFHRGENQTSQGFVFLLYVGVTVFISWLVLISQIEKCNILCAFVCYSTSCFFLCWFPSMSFRGCLLDWRALDMKTCVLIWSFWKLRFFFGFLLFP